MSETTLKPSSPSRSQFAVFIAVSLAIILLAHAAVYAALEAMFVGMSASASTTLMIAMAVLAIGFIAASILSSFFNNALVRVIYKIFAVWIGLFTYLFLVSVVYGLIAAFLDWRYSAYGTSVLANDHIAVFGRCLMGVALIAGIYGLLHARSIKVRHWQVTLEHLPSSWQGRKAVFFSDSHLGHVNGVKFAAKIAEAIKKELPDIVMIGGDLYDGVKVDDDAIIAPFTGLKPLLGTYFITGNHEEFQDSAHFIEAIKRAGIRVLDDEMTEIEGLQLVGVTDRDSTNKNRFAEILAGLKLDPNKPSILLKHQPSNLIAAESAGISLQLSGHTHRAQQWPFTYLTHRIFKGYDYGLNQFGRMQVYTSSGVGTWGPPLRLGTDAEIVVLEFLLG